MKIKSTLKAGGLKSNHNQTLPIKSTLKAGGIVYNHNQTAR